MIRTSLLAAILAAAAMSAAAFPIASVNADLETTPNEQTPITGITNATIANSDADDPAIWVHPTDKSKSLIFATAKDGGLRVYNLSGTGLRDVDVDNRNLAPGRIRSRFNNADVQYDFNLNGKRVDLLVATDRGQDKLKIWTIDAATGALTDVGKNIVQSLYPGRPLSDQATGYGLALYRDKANDKLYALVTQRREPVIAKFELMAQADGKIAANKVQSWTFPDTYKAQNLRQEGADPRQDWNPQFEGIVVDQRTGTVFAGQESVGIWKFNVNDAAAPAAPIVETRGSGDADTATYGPFYNPDSPISRDVEGLTIYYLRNGKGYLLASSQGAAHGDEATYVDPSGVDDSYAVFDIQTNAYLGSFKVVAGGGIDGVQESDGADVIGLQLPGYAKGFFIAQDGYNGTNADGTEDLVGLVRNNNFKILGWDKIALADGFNLKIQPFAWDPRTQAAVPAPAALALFGLGLGALALRRRG